MALLLARTVSLLRWAIKRIMAPDAKCAASSQAIDA